MEGTGTVPHCAVLASFVATMGKVSRAAAGEASCRAVPQPLKYKNKMFVIEVVMELVIRGFEREYVGELLGIFKINSSALETLTTTGLSPHYMWTTSRLGSDTAVST